MNLLRKVPKITENNKLSSEKWSVWVVYVPISKNNTINKKPTNTDKFFASMAGLPSKMAASGSLKRKVHAELVALTQKAPEDHK